MSEVTVSIPPVSELPLAGGRPADPDNISEEVTLTQWRTLGPQSILGQVSFTITFRGSGHIAGETVISVTGWDQAFPTSTPLVETRTVFESGFVTVTTPTAAFDGDPQVSSTTSSQQSAVVSVVVTAGPEAEEPPLSMPAAIGVGIGGFAGFLILVGAGFFLWRRKRRLSAANRLAASPTQTSTFMPEMPDGAPKLHEGSTPLYYSAQEIQPPAELDGMQGPVIAELPARGKETPN